MAEHAELSSLLMPVPTYRLVTAIRAYEEEPSDFTAERLEYMLRQVSAATAEMTNIAQLAEFQLQELTKRSGTADVSTEAVELGRSLYDPYDECIWGHQYYQPRRLTDLLPYRVSDLLGEQES